MLCLVRVLLMEENLMCDVFYHDKFNVIRQEIKNSFYLKIRFSRSSTLFIVKKSRAYSFQRYLKN